MEDTASIVSKEKKQYPDGTIMHIITLSCGCVIARSGNLVFGTVDKPIWLRCEEHRNAKPEEIRINSKNFSLYNEEIKMTDLERMAQSLIQGIQVDFPRLDVEKFAKRLEEKGFNWVLILTLLFESKKP